MQNLGIYRLGLIVRAFALAALLSQTSCLSKQKSAATPETPSTPPILLTPPKPVVPIPQIPPPVVIEPNPSGARAEVLWPELNEKIFKPRCVGCHQLNNTLGISNFSDLETVRSTVPTIFYYVIFANGMPPAPSDWPETQPNPNQLNSLEKDLLSHWINDGMKGEAEP